jgi:hypothetical protein
VCYTINFPRHSNNIQTESKKVASSLSQKTSASKVSILHSHKNSEILEVVGGCRRLYKEEFHNLHALLNIIRAIKSRRMGQAGHVNTYGRDKKCIQDFGQKT